MAPAKNSAISLSDDEEILSLVILKVSNTIALCKNFVTNGWSKNLFFYNHFAWLSTFCQVVFYIKTVI